MLSLGGSVSLDVKVDQDESGTQWLRYYAMGFLSVRAVTSLAVVIAKFLQFQPEVQQKFFNCRCFEYSVVVFFKACTVVRKHGLNTTTPGVHCSRNVGN